MSALDSLFGFFTEGIAGAAEARAEKEANDFNYRRLYDAKKYSEGQATDELNRGAMDAGLIRQKGSAIEAQQAVAFASNGIDASTGTPASIMDASRMYAELDASTTMNNARRAALGHKQAAKDYEREAQRLGIDARAKAQARETRTLLAWGKGVTSIATGGIGGGL